MCFYICSLFVRLTFYFLAMACIIYISLAPGIVDHSYYIKPLILFSTLRNRHRFYCENDPYIYIFPGWISNRNCEAGLNCWSLAPDNFLLYYQAVSSFYSPEYFLWIKYVGRNEKHFALGLFCFFSKYDILYLSMLI